MSAQTTYTQRDTHIHTYIHTYNKHTYTMTQADCGGRKRERADHIHHIWPGCEWHKGNTIQTYTCQYMHTCLHTYFVHGCMHTYIIFGLDANGTKVILYRHTHVNTCIHAYIHILYMDACIHTSYSVWMRMAQR